MKKFLFRLFIIALAAFGIYAGVREIQGFLLGKKFTSELSAEERASRLATALKLTKNTLEEVTSPNIAGRIATSDLQRAVTERLPLDEVEAQGFKMLQLSNARIAASLGSLLLSIDVEGELDSAPLKFAGKVDFEVAPAFDGAGLTLVPLDVTPRFQRIRAFGVESDRLLPSLVSGLVDSLAGAVSRRMTSISIPLTLAGATDLNLATSLKAVEGVTTVEAPELKLRLAIEQLAALPTQEGVEFVGRASVVSNAQFDAARQAIHELRAHIPEIPAAPVCKPCQVSILKPKSSLDCWEKAISCHLGLDSGPSLEIAGSVERLALREMLRTAPEAERKELERIQALLRPRFSSNPASGWNDSSVDLLESVVVERMRAARTQIDSVPEPSAGSRFAVRRDFLASALNEVLAQSSVSLGITIPDRLEGIHQTINTGPAPDLKCQANARDCPSVFDYPGYRPRGCDSDCGTTNCHDTWLGRVCLPGIDLGCQSQKYDCERLKEQERLAYEAQKTTRLVEWTAGKVACEAQKTLELTGCELNQAWLNAFQDMDVGRIAGEARTMNGSAYVADATGSFTSDLSSGRFNATVSGDVRVEASFVFEPLSAGYVICVAQWGGTVGTNVGLRPMEVDLDVELVANPEAPSNSLVFRTHETIAKLVLDPSPGMALLTQAPQMVLACHVPGAILATLPGLDAASKLNLPIRLDLGQEIEVNLPAREIKIDLTPEFATTPGQPDVLVRVTTTAVVITGMPAI